MAAEDVLDTATTGTGDGDAPPHLHLVKEFIRYALTAEKNLELYPAYSKIVKTTLKELYNATQTYMRGSGESLFLNVTRSTFEYEGVPVYEEEHKGKSLAFRLYKDGVREFTITPDVTQDDLTSFFSCYHDIRQVDEEDYDFASLFWERDCKTISLNVIDQTEASDDEMIPDIADFATAVARIDAEKIHVAAEEQKRLTDILEDSMDREDEGEEESPFLLSAEEEAQLQKLVDAENDYFAVDDFLKVLIEVMAQSGSTTAFEESLSVIRGILKGLVENLEFKHAAMTLEKLVAANHPGLTDENRAAIRDLIQELCTEDVYALIGGFLRESEKLNPRHPIFRFMKMLGAAPVERYCQFLQFSHQLPGVVQLLPDLARGNEELFLGYLEHSDPNVVRAMMVVVLKAFDSGVAIQKICELLEHPNEAIRLEAASTIHKNADPASGIHLVSLLKSKSSSQITSALRFFAKHECADAYDSILDLTNSKMFAEFSNSERALVISALSKSDSARALLYLQGLLKSPFCLTKKRRKLKGAALFSLAQTQPYEARDIAERFLKSRGMRDVASQALRIIEQQASARRKKRLAEQAQEEAAQ